MCIRSSLFLVTFLSMQALCAQQPLADPVPGYRHTAAKSRFFAGESPARVKRVEENGFVKYQGINGVLAIDEVTGLTVAVQSNSHNKASRLSNTAVDSTSLLEPEEHNKRVLDYFVHAGLPRNQVAEMHANTYLSASGPTSKAISLQPRVDGYASILSRKAGDFIVPDSVAWARMNMKGKVLGEWVYWPPIPSKVIDDARRLNELLNGPDRREYLSKLPSVQKMGRVVIRHSSPFAGGAFESYASYDVVERTESPERGTAVAYVRHFGIDGQEIRLPQERRSLGVLDYPPKEGAQTLQK